MANSSTGYGVSLRPLAWACAAALVPASALLSADAAAPAATAAFHRDVAPILDDYCYSCHGEGMAKGKISLDELSDTDLLDRKELWASALKNLRANIMPPAGKPRPSAEETKKIADWIKYKAFAIDPADPDPGRVTIRRLNRIEYGHTVRALLGVDYPSEAEFPPDDTGHGFDNIGDVLSTSPLLLEKYLQAAETVVSSTVPQSSRIVPVTTITGRDFRDYAEPQSFEGSEGEDGGRAARAAVGKPVGYDENLTLSHVFTAPREATYHVAFNFAIRGPFNFAPARSHLVVKIDGAVRYDEALGWHDRKPLLFAYDEPWKAGPHEISVAMSPLSPADLPPDSPGAAFEEKQKLELRINSVQVKGPFEVGAQVLPPNYHKFFPRDEVPAEPAERERYAREILGGFASRAFRRPVDDATLTRLVRLAHSVETSPDGTFELGVSRAMMAVLASPRFIFRTERSEAADTGARFPRVDEYSLASRLSYFLWSTMPDGTLLDLAEKGELRKNLRAQVDRMLRDPQASAFVRNFTGQWLEARDVEFIPINARAVLGLPPPRRGGPKADFDSETRKAMRNETESVFDYILQSDRSVLELIESNYTFLNEKLAKVYGIAGVSGAAMRLVTLPEDSPRGGVLTEGTVLTVTSNPTRTSPVKRGQFILENILGTPAPPAPPNIPALEEAKSAFVGRDPTLREMLAIHRENTLCQSCHARMDPLGLALENFNALGNWRDRDAGQPIDSTGKLITGETFTTVRELKHIIATERKSDFYRCLTEKLLTYALGRGLDYYDVETVDRIVESLERDNGRFSSLLLGVIDSAPFQKQRVTASSGMTMSAPSSSAKTTAE